MSKGKRTKKRIFEAAAELFLRDGIESVTVDAIVEKAGVSKGTFYIYFESKDALIAEFLSDYVRNVDADYTSLLGALTPDITSGEMLLSFVGSICDVLSEKIGCRNMRNLYRAHLAEAADTSLVLSYNRQVYKLFSFVLQRGVLSGEFNTTMSVDELARHLVLALRGLCFEWCCRYPDFDLKENALAHFRFLLNALKAPPKGDSGENNAQPRER